MNKPAAFRATYSDLKLIKTRQCVQVIFELPLADFDAAYQILGGMPNPASETWFGIAPLVAPPAAKEKIATPQPATDKPLAGAKRMDWRELQPATQAALRCDQPAFQAFLREEHNYSHVSDTDSAANAVRHICVVKSRSEFSTDHRKRVLWKQLDDQFQAWQRVGA